MWFSDSSTKYGIENWKDDFVQDTRTGRLLRLGTDGRIDVVLDGLAFANGVALGRRRVVRRRGRVRRPDRRPALAHRRPGRPARLLVDDLPGYPDNIARGSDGLIWVTIASPRDPLWSGSRRGRGGCAARSTRIPERLQPKPKRTVRVQAYDDSGTLVHDRDVPATGTATATTWSPASASTTAGSGWAA